MANATVAQQVSRATVAAAIRQAKVEAAEHEAWVRAINKASINLEICSWRPSFRNCTGNVGEARAGWG